MFSSCRETEDLMVDKLALPTFEKNEYNKDLNEFTLAVREAYAKSTEFIRLVKNDVLKKFDGDYNVLLSQIQDKQVDGGTAQRGQISVKNLLAEHYPFAGNSSTARSSTSVIEELIEKYPSLQIAVPVNAEYLTDDVVPLTTFIPLECDEAITNEIVGYDAEGNEVRIDVRNEPEEPVIVIGMNERVKKPCLNLIDCWEPDQPVNVALPPTPTNLTATANEAGIRLSWDIPANTTVGEIGGYYIYKQGATNSFFVKAYTVLGMNARVYTDAAVTVNASYTYYVIAFRNTYESQTSNYVSITAPPRPKPVVAFDAIQQSKNQIELRWQNDNTQFINSTILSRMIVGQDNNYREINRFGINQQDYFDTTFPIGKKILYKVTHETSVGISDAKYDFVKTPYRDISKNSPLYIKWMVVSDRRDIELWPKGAPEFYIKVMNVDQLSKEPYEVQEQIDIDWPQTYDGLDWPTPISSNNSGPLQVKVMDWRPGFWYDMLTFKVQEYDKPSGDWEFDITAGFNIKDTAILDTEVGASLKRKFKFEDNGNDCGKENHSYFDNPEIWLEFPSFGLEILISEKRWDEE